MKTRFISKRVMQWYSDRCNIVVPQCPDPIALGRIAPKVLYKRERLVKCHIG